MATILEKAHVIKDVKIAEGLQTTPMVLEILGMEKAMQARYDSLGDLRSGFGSIVEKKGRFWYYQNGCLYYKNSTNVFEIHGDIYRKWVKLGKEKFGRPDTNESPCADGTGRFNHFENGTRTIFWHPSTGANAVEGDIKIRWNDLGWERSYLGYPSSDESACADGGRVNSFQHGGIYWWPDSGAVDINDVAVQYTGLMCYEESDWDQSSDSDEPYVVIGIVTPFETGAYQTPTFSNVDSGDSIPGLMEIYRGKPNGIAITVRLMEHDEGDRNKYTEDIAKAMTTAHSAGTLALGLIPVVGAGIAAVVGPLIQKFIPDIAKSVNGLFGFGDEEIGRQTIMLTGKEMILAARRNNLTQRGIGYKFASKNLKRGGSNYKVYFSLVAI